MVLVGMGWGLTATDHAIPSGGDGSSHVIAKKDRICFCCLLDLTWSLLVVCK